MTIRPAKLTASNWAGENRLDTRGMRLWLSLPEAHGLCATKQRARLSDCDRSKAHPGANRRRVITPHAFVDIKTRRAKGAGLRLGGGPTILMATKTGSDRERFATGFSIYVNFGLWAPY